MNEQRFNLYLSEDLWDGRAAYVTRRQVAIYRNGGTEIINAEQEVLCAKGLRRYLDLPRELPKELDLVFTDRPGPHWWELSDSFFNPIAGVRTETYITFDSFCEQARRDGFTHVHLEI